MNAVVETSDTHADSPPLPATVVRLGWVSFLTDVSSEMIVSLLPAFLVGVLGAPARAIGIIEGVAEATASALKVVAGRLADRASAKKPLVLLGYGLSSLVRPLIAVATAWPAVLVVRFADRIGKGIRSAPRDALIASVTPPGRRGAAFGLHRAFDNAGAVVGPLVAATLVGLFAVPVRTVFALALVPGLSAVAVLVFGVKEPSVEPVEAGRSGGPAPRSAPLPPAFRRFAAVLVLFTLANSSDTFLLLKAREIGVGVAWLPVVWSYSNAVRALLGSWGGRLSDRIGRRRVLLAGWTVYAVSYAGFAVTTSVPLLLALIGGYGFHAALSEAAERALVADLVPAESRGRAFGWMHGLTGFAALPASAGFGLVWERLGSASAFGLAAALAALATVALAIAVRPRPIT